MKNLYHHMHDFVSGSIAQKMRTLNKMGSLPNPTLSPYLSLSLFIFFEYKWLIEWGLHKYLLGVYGFPTSAHIGSFLFNNNKRIAYFWMHSLPTRVLYQIQRTLSWYHCPCCSTMHCVWFSHGAIFLVMYVPSMPLPCLDNNSKGQENFLNSLCK